MANENLDLVVANIYDLDNQDPNRKPMYYEFLTSIQIQYCRLFEVMELSDQLRFGIFDYGFERPLELQQNVMMSFLAGRNLVVKADHGTGKVALGCIAALEIARSVTTKCIDPQIIILAPITEMALEFHSMILELGKYMDDVECVACVDSNFTGRDHAVRSKLIVTGVPDVVIDMIEAGKIGTRQTNLVVLYNVDELVDMGFDEDIEEIFYHLRDGYQAVSLSTNLTVKCCQLLRQFIVQPMYVRYKRTDYSLSDIKHFHIPVESEESKLATLLKVYAACNNFRTVVFCDTQKKVDWLAESLRGNNLTLDTMHHDWKEGECDAILANFEAGKTKLLVTTDVWNVNWDLPKAAVVINYDCPASHRIYAPRIYHTRCRRVAVSLTLENDIQFLPCIQTQYLISINQAPEDLNSCFA